MSLTFTIKSIQGVISHDTSRDETDEHFIAYVYAGFYKCPQTSMFYCW